MTGLRGFFVTSLTDNTPTLHATKLCGEWLANCLRLGWSRAELDWLEALWWEHHDHTGQLKITKKGL